VALIRASGGAAFVGTDETADDVVLTLVGELDLAFAPTLLTAIREAIAAAPRRIVLDFGSVSFIDSGGCDMLALACQEAAVAGVRIAMYEEMALRVRRVLAVTMLLSMFDPVWPILNSVTSEGERSIGVELGPDHFAAVDEFVPPPIGGCRDDDQSSAADSESGRMARDWR